MSETVAVPIAAIDQVFSALEHIEDQIKIVDAELLIIIQTLQGIVQRMSPANDCWAEETLTETQEQVERLKATRFKLLGNSTPDLS